MTIKPFYFNPYRECTYVVWDEQKQNHKALLIDAGMYGETEEKRMADFLTKENLSLIALLITHTHPDHICGVDFVRSKYGIEPIICPPESALQIPDFEGIEVLHTPGTRKIVCATIGVRKAVSLQAIPFSKILSGVLISLVEICLR